MTNPTKVIVDCETGEQTIVPLDANELAQLEADSAAFTEMKAKEEADAKKLADLKASARTKLIAGEPLTEEEAATIVL